jgi:hypothetical protein
MRVWFETAAVETKAGMGSNGLDSTNFFGTEEGEPNLSPFLHKLFKEVGSVCPYVCC